MASSFTDFLKKQRVDSKNQGSRSRGILNALNGVTGEATLRQAPASTAGNTNASTQPATKPQMSAGRLTALATASTAAEAGLAVGLASEQGTLASYCTTVTSFVAENMLIPNTLAGNIATAAGLAFTAGVLTAGLIDFADRIHTAKEGTYFRCNDLPEFLMKAMTTITSATGLPSVFLLIQHTLLLLASLLNALVVTLTLRGKEQSAAAWTEVSENSRAICFRLVALALIPLGNVIDLLGTAVSPAVQKVGTFFNSPASRLPVQKEPEDTETPKITTPA